MAVKSLTRIFCDKCNPDKLDGGSGATYQGVLTVASLIGDTFPRTIKADMEVNGWQCRGNGHVCPICVKEEQEEADAQNKAFRQSRTGRR